MIPSGVGSDPFQQQHIVHRPQDPNIQPGPFLSSPGTGSVVSSSSPNFIQLLSPTSQPGANGQTFTLNSSGQPLALGSQPLSIAGNSQSLTFTNSSQPVNIPISSQSLTFPSVSQPLNINSNQPISSHNLPRQSPAISLGSGVVVGSVPASGASVVVGGPGGGFVYNSQQQQNVLVAAAMSQQHQQLQPQQIQPFQFAQLPTVLQPTMSNQQTNQHSGQNHLGGVQPPTSVGGYSPVVLQPAGQHNSPLQFLPNIPGGVFICGPPVSLLPNPLGQPGQQLAVPAGQQMVGGQANSIQVNSSQQQHVSRNKRKLKRAKKIVQKMEDKVDLDIHEKEEIKGSESLARDGNNRFTSPAPGDSPKKLLSTGQQPADEKMPPNGHSPRSTSTKKGDGEGEPSTSSCSQMRKRVNDGYDADLDHGKDQDDHLSLQSDQLTSDEENHDDEYNENNVRGDSDDDSYPEMPVLTAEVPFSKMPPQPPPPPSAKTRRCSNSGAGPRTGDALDKQDNGESSAKKRSLADPWPTSAVATDKETDQIAKTSHKSYHHRRQTSHLSETANDDKERSAFPFFPQKAGQKRLSSETAPAKPRDPFQANDERAALGGLKADSHLPAPDNADSNRQTSASSKSFGFNGDSDRSPPTFNSKSSPDKLDAGTSSSSSFIWGKQPAPESFDLYDDDYVNDYLKEQKRKKVKSRNQSPEVIGGSKMDREPSRPLCNPKILINNGDEENAVDNSLDVIAAGVPESVGAEIEDIIQSGFYSGPVVGGTASAVSSRRNTAGSSSGVGEAASVAGTATATAVGGVRVSDLLLLKGGDDESRLSSSSHLFGLSLKSLSPCVSPPIAADDSSLIMSSNDNKHKDNDDEEVGSKAKVSDKEIAPETDNIERKAKRNRTLCSPKLTENSDQPRRRKKPAASASSPAATKAAAKRRRKASADNLHPNQLPEDYLDEVIGQYFNEGESDTDTSFEDRRGRKRGAAKKSASKRLDKASVSSKKKVPKTNTMHETPSHSSDSDLDDYEPLFFKPRGDTSAGKKNGRQQIGPERRPGKRGRGRVDKGAGASGSGYDQARPRIRPPASFYSMEFLDYQSEDDLGVEDDEELYMRGLLVRNEQDGVIAAGSGTGSFDFKDDDPMENVRNKNSRVKTDLEMEAEYGYLLFGDRPKRKKKHGGLPKRKPVANQESRPTASGAENGGQPLKSAKSSSHQEDWPRPGKPGKTRASSQLGQEREAKPSTTPTKTTNIQLATVGVSTRCTRQSEAEILAATNRDRVANEAAAIKQEPAESLGASPAKYLKKKTGVVQSNASRLADSPNKSFTKLTRSSSSPVKGAELERTIDQQSWSGKRASRNAYDHRSDAASRKRKKPYTSDKIEDVTGKYGKEEEMVTCGICLMLDPPEDDDPNAESTTEWVGCDCYRWFHKSCTQLMKFTEKFSCKSVKMKCQEPPPPPEAAMDVLEEAEEAEAGQPSSSGKGKKKKIKFMGKRGRRMKLRIQFVSDSMTQIIKDVMPTDLPVERKTSSHRASKKM